MRIIFLGTGGSLPSVGRGLPAVALYRSGEGILFDCGEGTQRQLMRSSLSFMRIERVLISHFHGDHFLGLPGLLQSMAFNGRSEPLSVYGPHGIKRLVETIGNLGYFPHTFPIRVVEMGDKTEVDCGDYWLRTRAVDHLVPTLAYCLEEKARQGKFDVQKAHQLGIPEGPLYRRLQGGKTITVEGKKIKPEAVVGPPRPGRKVVYSGDTRPTQAVVDLAMGCDVLIHDATMESDLERQCFEYGHSTPAQAAQIAVKSKAKMLFLTHISPRYDEKGKAKRLEDEARAVFPHSVIARDLLEYVVKYAE